jgi:hypothetical protein
MLTAAGRKHRLPVRDQHRVAHHVTEIICCTAKTVV